MRQITGVFYFKGWVIKTSLLSYFIQKQFRLHERWQPNWISRRVSALPWRRQCTSQCFISQDDSFALQTLTTNLWLCDWRKRLNVSKLLYCCWRTRPLEKISVIDSVQQQTGSSATSVTPVTFFSLSFPSFPQLRRVSVPRPASFSLSYRQDKKSIVYHGGRRLWEGEEIWHLGVRE